MWPLGCVNCPQNYDEFRLKKLHPGGRERPQRLPLGPRESISSQASGARAGGFESERRPEGSRRRRGTSCSQSPSVPEWTAALECVNTAARLASAGEPARFWAPGLFCRGSRQLLGGETVAWSAEGGPRITDRDLGSVVVTAEHLMAAQIHRFKEGG